MGAESLWWRRSECRHAPLSKRAAYAAIASHYRLSPVPLIESPRERSVQGQFKTGGVHAGFGSSLGAGRGVGGKVSSLRPPD